MIWSRKERTGDHMGRRKDSYEKKMRITYVVFGDWIFVPPVLAS